MDSFHSIPSYVKHARTAEGTQGKEQHQKGARWEWSREGASPMSGFVRKVINMLARSSHTSVGFFFFLGRLVCMDWDDWWSKPSSLQRTNMFGQICFFQKYSGVPRSWVVRTMNISPLLRTKGNGIYDRQFPSMTSVLAHTLNSLCFISLQKLPATWVEQREEGTAQMLCLGC